ncbi:MAG TPA: DHH family phosphoesterase [Euryarchaeota archaeon]|nr:DHH family phosphoesterase [Euryarchaeota archaeon]
MTGLPEPLQRALGSDFLAVLDFFAKTVRDHRGEIRVITHDDADGICAGGVMGKALRRMDKSFHMTSVKGLSNSLIQELDREGNELVIVLDMGSGHMDLFEKCAGTFLVVDHHTISTKPGKTVYLLNPHDFNRDGSREVSGSTMAFLLGLALDGDNWNLLSTAIAGSIGDKQDMGGFTGINQLLVELGEESGALETFRDMDLQDTPLKKSIPDSLDPFYIHYCSNSEIAVKDLESVGLDGDKKLSELSSKEREALATLLSTELMSARIRPESIRMFRKIMVRDKKSLTEARHLSKIVNACGKMGKNGMGLAIAMGDLTFMEKGIKIRAEYRKGIREEMRRLCCEGVEVQGGIQYFHTSDGLRSGAVCGLAMLYIVNQNMPLFSIFKDKEEYKISARGTGHLVKKGLDLARACRESAKMSGGQGGGHVIASGATIPENVLEDFLNNAGIMVKEQLNL